MRHTLPPASCLIIPCISHVTTCYIHVRFISTTIHVTSYCGSFTTDLKNKNHVGCIDSGANVDSHHQVLNQMGDIHVSDYMSSHGLYFIMCDIILFTCPAITTAEVTWVVLCPIFIHSHYYHAVKSALSSNDTCLTSQHPLRSYTYRV